MRLLSFVNAVFFVCLFSEADGDGASKRGKKKKLGVLYGGVYTLCLSKLEPLAVPGLAHTYMAADQSLNSFLSLRISA